MVKNDGRGAALHGRGEFADTSVYLKKCSAVPSGTNSSASMARILETSRDPRHGGGRICSRRKGRPGAAVMETSRAGPWSDGRDGAPPPNADEAREKKKNSGSGDSTCQTAEEDPAGEAGGQVLCKRGRVRRGAYAEGGRAAVKVRQRLPRGARHRWPIYRQMSSPVMEPYNNKSAGLESKSPHSSTHIISSGLWPI